MSTAMLAENGTRCKEPMQGITVAAVKPTFALPACAAHLRLKVAFEGVAALTRIDRPPSAYILSTRTWYLATPPPPPPPAFSFT
jgi:hypothetical protein